MAGEPNELPEGGEGGGGHILVPRHEIAELPQFVTATSAASRNVLLQEVLNLRGRMHQMENAQLIQAAAGHSAAAVAFHPAELPEGGEGGGSLGGFHGEFPGEFPAELPAVDRLAALENRVAQLSESIAQLVQVVKPTQG